MGSEFLTYQQDPSWGSLATNIAKSIAGAPKAALDQKLTVEHIVALQQKQAEDKAKFDAAVAAGDTAAAAIATAGPPQSTRDIPIEQQGPVNPADPTTQPGETFLPPTSYQEKYVDPKVAERYKAELPFFQATARAQAHQGAGDLAGGYAKARVGLSGAPADQDEQNRLQFLTTGRFRTGEEKSVPAAHTLAVIGIDGQPTGQRVTTNNNKTELGTNRPLFGPNGVVPQGHTLATTGPTDLTPKLDESTARERLAVIARQSVGRDLTQAERMNIAIFAPTAYPSSRVLEEANGVKQEKYVHTQEMPPHVVDLLGRGGMLSTSGTGTPVDPNASRVTGSLAGDPLDISDRVMRTQEVKDYLSAIPSYNSLIEATNRPINNTTDLQIVYAIAKLFDPGSVVREGEIKLTQGAGTMAQQMAALYSKLFTDQGMMSAETRANLIEQGYVRMKEYEQNRNVVTDHFRDTVSKSRGVDPNVAVPKMPEMHPFDKEAILQRGRAVDPAAATATPATGARRGAAAPAVPPVVQRGNEAFGVQ